MSRILVKYSNSNFPKQNPQNLRTILIRKGGGEFSSTRSRGGGKLIQTPRVSETAPMLLKLGRAVAHTPSIGHIPSNSKAACQKEFPRCRRKRCPPFARFWPRPFASGSRLPRKSQVSY